MIAYRALRQMFDTPLQEAQRNSRSRGHGLLEGLRVFHDTLGLDTDARSGRPMIRLDDRGLPVLKPNRERAREFSLRNLAEAIMGKDFTDEYYDPTGGFNFAFLREAAIDPSAFQNINTFNLAVAGLVNAEIMERFNQPVFFGRNLVTVKPTKMNGQKLVAVARMGSYSANAKGRKPGEQHAEVGLSEAYQTTPETLEQALKCRVTREAVFFDITDQVLDEAGEVGHELAYGQEKDIADMVLGVTGLAGTYNRNGTSYECYQTASPWINDASNPFSDWSDIDDARQNFVGMTDPESGKEIVVMGTTVLCTPAKELLMRQQMFGPNVQMGTQLNSNFPSTWTVGGNPLAGVGQSFTLTNMGAIWYNRLTAADGLNLSASNAVKYWYIGDYAKAFWWMENWPMTPWMASADETRMKDEGLVAIFGANYRGRGYTREPRYVDRNKN